MQFVNYLPNPEETGSGWNGTNLRPPFDELYHVFTELCLPPFNLVPFHDAESGETKSEVPGWKPGDHDHNLALVLRKEHENVMNEARARGIDLSHLTYDPKTNNHHRWPYRDHPYRRNS